MSNTEVLAMQGVLLAGRPEEQDWYNGSTHTQQPTLILDSFCGTSNRKGFDFIVLYYYTSY